MKAPLISQSVLSLPDQSASNKSADLHSPPVYITHSATHSSRLNNNIIIIILFRPQTQLNHLNSQVTGDLTCVHLFLHIPNDGQVLVVTILLKRRIHIIRTCCLSSFPLYCLTCPTGCVCSPGILILTISSFYSFLSCRSFTFATFWQQQQQHQRLSEITF